MLRQPIPVWVVAHGDELYVRSVNGPAAAWYRGAQATHEGHIHAGGVAKDVTFVDADPSLADTLDAAYRTKYRRYPQRRSHRQPPGARRGAQTRAARRRVDRPTRSATMTPNAQARRAPRRPLSRPRLDPGRDRPRVDRGLRQLRLRRSAPGEPPRCAHPADGPARGAHRLAMLVALGGCDPQVMGHVAANLHVGNDRARLIDVLTQLLPFIGYPRTLNGLRAIDAVAPALPSQ